MKPLTFLASSIGFAALTVLVSAACADDQSSTGNPKARTILNTKCASCHGPETQKAELNLSSLAGIGRGGESGKLINSDKPEESLILEMIESGQMPPEGEAPLTGNERQLLRHWILDLARNPERLKVSPKALSQLDVQPLMLRRCWMCHGPEYQMGGLDLRTRDAMLAGGDSGSALIAGDADKSPMVLRVREQKCPPKADIGEAGIEPMTPDELKTLEAWIRQGAPLVPVEPDVAFGNNDPLVSDADRQFWSFQPPTRSAPPDVEQPELVRTPVDSFLLRQLEAEKLTFSPETDRVTLIRRASYALLGLPPSPELIERYSESDDPRWLEQLVDELLASPHYGERWGRFWLDLAGYADSEGKRHADMIRPWAWRYRDYVIRCFNEDRPYDQFLTEQIAGDELVDWADPALVNENVIEKLVATGFLRMAPDGTSADPVNRFSDRIEVLSDELDVLSRGLLGLTFNCARCHSHKYDPIPQRDYYRLVAVFKGAYDEYDWLTPQPFGNQWNKAKRRHLDVQTASLRRELDAEQAPVQKEIENLQRQLQQKGLGAKEKKKLQAALNKAKAKLPSAPLIRALWDRGRASPTFIYRRGDENQPGSPVEPGVPSALSSGKTPYEIVSPAHSSPKTGRRLAFARWLTASDHPLTARVFVNRIWQQHFGRGVVESVDNFGALGTKPSHPELLDWLAVEFVEGGWSIKRLHRLLMTSTAWRQQSTIDPASEAAERDPENRLLSRMPMRRLMAEEVRDSVLAVSERLNPMPFGKPDAVDIRGDGLVTSKPTAGHWRRSVYLRQRRKEMPTLFETFDLPQMNPNCTERQDSTVVSQPLYLLNNGMIHDLSDRLAAAVERQAGTSEQRQLQLAFVLTTGRPPTTGQLAIATESLQKLQADWRATAESAADKENVSHKALADFCHALLNSAAFLYVD